MSDTIKAVIFDMDGTLIDSMGLWGDIDRDFLAEIGSDMSPVELQRRIEGMSFDETADFFIDEFQLNLTAPELMKRWNDMAIEKYATSIPLKEGVREFLDLLLARGVKMAIATSNSAELTDPCLTRLGIAKHFEAIITSKDVKHGKPAPDVYLLAAKTLGVDPADCLVFEDIPAGILAGVRAGMTVVGVEDAHSAYCREEKKSLADTYIMSFKELTNGQIQRTLRLPEAP